MNEQETFYSNVEIRDALFKVDLYLKKIQNNNGPAAQIEKVVHLAAETCLKFCDDDNFTFNLYERLQNAIKRTQSYFVLYLIDILLKNNRKFLKLAQNELIKNWKSVWEKVWIENKNTSKIECLKAMVKTWAIIYDSQIQQSLQRWINDNYHVSLALDKKNEQLFNQVFGKLKCLLDQEKQKIVF